MRKLTREQAEELKRRIGENLGGPFWCGEGFFAYDMAAEAIEEVTATADDVESCKGCLVLEDWKRGREHDA